MLLSHLTRRVGVIPAYTMGLRCFAMATTSPQSFVLDRGQFNEAYSQVRSLWFAGLPKDSKTANVETAKRWFGVGSSDDDRAAYDSECRSRFGSVLDSVGPDKLKLPPFESYEKDIEQAIALSAPFHAKVQTALANDSNEGAETLLALILLLDQMPRNIYRDPAGLKLLYTHYDRISLSLMYSNLPLLSHPLWRGKPHYLIWLALPFIHAEHIPSHEIAREAMARCKAECEKDGNEAATGFINMGEKSMAQHLEPLEKFGRYPHRNQCLGRVNTEEEEAFLETAETFGVKQDENRGKKEHRDEL